MLFVTRQPSMIVGCLVSTCLLVYMIVAGAYLVRLVAWLAEHYQRRRNWFWNRGLSVPPTLAEFIDRDDLNRVERTFLVFYEESVVPSHPLLLLAVPGQLIKSIVQACLMIATRQAASHQIIAVMIVEMAYFVAILPRLRSNRLFGMVERCVSGLVIFYMLLKLITASNSMSETTRQSVFGTIMVVILYGIIVVSISFALFSLILILFQLCKRAILWFKQTKAQAQVGANQVHDDSRRNVNESRSQAEPSPSEIRSQAEPSPSEIRNQAEPSPSEIRNPVAVINSEAQTKKVQSGLRATRRPGFGRRFRRPNIEMPQLEVSDRKTVPKKEVASSQNKKNN